MADKSSEQGHGAEPEAKDAEAKDSAAKAEDPKDDFVTTHHSITVAGQQLPYAATTGRVVLRKEILTEDKFEGAQATAEVFMVAYTLDGADPASRPVTFAFNGGPGSSSVWLHLGVLGPRRVLSGD